MNSFIPISKPVFYGNEKKYLVDCIDTAWVSSAGQYITRFEKLNADFYQIKYGVAVANGTVALHLALVTLGIGPGDEVIVPALTFSASVNVVLYTGATPVLADVDLDSWTIDINACEELITERTKAIIPVHLYGQPCDMNKVLAFAEKHDLVVVEDCAEAHGAEFDGKRVGSFGKINCFSFYGNKIVTCGEGGICLTNDAELNDKMRVYRDHGMNVQKRYWHDLIGYNYRMTNMQAALGCAQMETIETILDKRTKVAEAYESRLKHYPLIALQKKLPCRKSVCWLFPVLIDTDASGMTTDLIRSKLAAKNIDSRPFFYPLHEMPPYQNLKYNNLKNSEMISKKGLSLPTFSNLDEEQIEYICENLIQIIDEKR